MAVQLLVTAHRTVTVLVADGERVGCIALRASAKLGIPASLLRLHQAGRELRSEELLPCSLLRGSAHVVASMRLLGGGGDQPDWTELGKMPSMGKKRGPDARAPDWHADPTKYAAKVERDLRDKGELVVAVGPFCVPCGKRFAKQTVFDAHLSGQKHLRALQRMGRHEEAMVCQLDVEAKRRKVAEFEEARSAVMLGQRRAQLLPPSEEDEQQSAARKAERDEKLRAREMLPMPSTVAAGSVYLDPDGLEKEGGGVPIDEVEGAGASHAEAPTQAAVGAAGAADAPAPPTLTMMKQAGVDDATLAASGSGVSASYTSGMQVGWS